MWIARPEIKIIHLWVNQRLPFLHEADLIEAIVDVFEVVGDSAEEALGLRFSISRRFGRIQYLSDFLFKLDGVFRAFIGGIAEQRFEESARRSRCFWGKLIEILLEFEGIGFIFHFVWRFAREHVQGGRAEREIICLRDKLAEVLLWRHIADRSRDGRAVVHDARSRNSPKVDEIQFCAMPIMIAKFA